MPLTVVFEHMLLLFLETFLSLHIPLSTFTSTLFPPYPCKGWHKTVIDLETNPLPFQLWTIQSQFQLSLSKQVAPEYKRKLQFSGSAFPRWVSPWVVAFKRRIVSYGKCRRIIKPLKPITEEYAISSNMYIWTTIDEQALEMASSVQISNSNSRSSSGNLSNISIQTQAEGKLPNFKQK